MKGMSYFQKAALMTLLCILLLVFVGAIVRATGAGMGCPDWPTCWGQIIPPTDASQIDASQLDMEKFERKLIRFRGSADGLTQDSVLAWFNPVHTWTEFINRCVSLPVGLFSLLTMVLSFRYRRSKPSLFWGSLMVVVLVGLNAWMGMKIVETGLHPGVITTHMALTILLICVLVYLIQVGEREAAGYHFLHEKKGKLRLVGVLLFVLVVGEGIMGSQVRELTDALHKTHIDAPRSEWVDELEQSMVYLAHRSFSWLVAAGAIALFVLCRRHKEGGVGWREMVVLGVVCSQMVLGLILAHVGILPIAQVLHIGLSSILVCSLFSWLLGAFSVGAKA